MNIFDKKVISLQPEIFGLDLADGELKIVQLKTSGRSDALVGHANKKIPEGIIENGEIMQKDKIAELIQGALEHSAPRRIRSRKAICSIPESKAFLRVVVIPSMSEQEAAEAVKWEIGANIPMDISEVYYDWQFINTSKTHRGGTQSVLTVSVAKKVVHNYLEALQGAGIDVWGLELESIALLRALTPENTSVPDRSVSFVVDAGMTRTSLIVSERGIPFFTSSIPFSRHGVVEMVIKKLHVSRAEAEEILDQHGIGLTTKNRLPLRASLEPALAELAGEIEKTIHFYQETLNKNVKIGQVILSGQNLLKGMSVYLSKRFKLEILEGNPWINLNLGNKLPPIAKDTSLKYAIAVGLAMKGARYVSSH